MNHSEPLKFKQLQTNAVLPTRGSAAAAGLDLHCLDPVSLLPHPQGYYGRIAPRSGLAMKTGLDVLAGVLDADYRGEILCLLYNTGDQPIELPAGSKICQLILERIITPEAVWSDDLAVTGRGAGGFGSTG